MEYACYLFSSHVEYLSYVHTTAYLSIQLTWAVLSSWLVVICVLALIKVLLVKVKYLMEGMNAVLLREITAEVLYT